MELVHPVLSVESPLRIHHEFIATTLKAAALEVIHSSDRVVIGRKRVW
jgi:hypothetical protein